MNNVQPIRTLRDLEQLRHRLESEGSKQRVRLQKDLGAIAEPWQRAWTTLERVRAITTMVLPRLQYAGILFSLLRRLFSKKK